jgi:hypothetical protein
LSRPMRLDCPPASTNPSAEDPARLKVRPPPLPETESATRSPAGSSSN